MPAEHIQEMVRAGDLAWMDIFWRFRRLYERLSDEAISPAPHPAPHPASHGFWHVEQVVTYHFTVLL
jgi:hypothetical protein